MLTDAEIARLRAIATELDTLETRRDELYEERLALWRKGKKAGMNARELAAPSLVKSVTVRKLMSKET